MTCQEARDLLYEIIDKEASEIDVNQVQRHLEKCRHCSEIYDLESKLNQLIAAKLNGDKQENSACVSRLRDKILVDLDKIDEENGSTRKRPFEFAAKTLVAAASLVVLIGASFFFTNLYHHYRDYRPLEQAHIAMVSEAATLANPNHTSTALSLVSSTMNYRLAESVDGFHMIGGDTCQLCSSQMAHFVYESDGRLISVFVAPAATFQIPDELEDSRVARGSIEFFLHDCPGCRLAYHQVGDAVIITATYEADIELAEFVPGQGTI